MNLDKILERDIKIKDELDLNVIKQNLSRK